MEEKDIYEIEDVHVDLDIDISKLNRDVYEELVCVDPGIWAESSNDEKTLKVKQIVREYLSDMNDYINVEFY